MTEDNTPADAVIADAIDMGGNKYRHENGLIMGKFKTEEDVIKGYTELERKLGSAPKAEAAPEAYEISLADDVKDRFVLNNTELAGYQAKFKEIGLSNKAASELVNTFAKAEIAKGEAIAKDIEDTLGDKKEEVYKDIQLFIKDMPEDDRDRLLAMPRSGKDTLLLHKIITANRSGTVPDTAAITDTRTAQSYRDEAFAYQKEHALTIGSSKEQQDHYNNLMAKYANGK